MTVSSFLVITAMMLLPLEPVQLSGGGNFHGSDKAEIEKAFSNYNQALVDKEYEELTPYIQVPFVVIDGSPRTITDIASVVAGLRRSRESLDEKGYAKSIP